MDTGAIYVYGIWNKNGIINPNEDQRARVWWQYLDLIAFREWRFQTDNLFGEGRHLPDNSVPFEVGVKREEQK